MSSPKHDTAGLSIGLRKRRRSHSASPMPDCDEANYGRGKRVARPSQKAASASIAAPAQYGRRDGSKKTVQTVKSGIRLKLNPPADSKTSPTASTAINTTTPSSTGKKRKASAEALDTREAESSGPMPALETRPVVKRIKLSFSTPLQTLNSALERVESSVADSAKISASAEPPAAEPESPTSPPRPTKITASEFPVTYLLLYLRSMPLPPESQPEKRDAFIDFKNIVIRWLTGSRFSYHEKRLLCRDWWKTQREAPLELEWIRVRDKCDKATAKATLIKEQAAAKREVWAREREVEEKRYEAERQRRDIEARRKAHEEDQMAARALLALQR